MRIGEVSQILDISSSAIRFYERQGLIGPGKVHRTENGYRLYSQANVEELRQVLKLKQFGLELQDIKNLMSEESSSCGDMVSNIDAQLEQCRAMEQIIQQRIASLMEARQRCGSECQSGVELRSCCVLSA